MRPAGLVFETPGINYLLCDRSSRFEYLQKYCFIVFSRQMVSFKFAGNLKGCPYIFVLTGTVFLRLSNFSSTYYQLYQVSNFKAILYLKKTWTTWTDNNYIYFERQHQNLKSLSMCYFFKNQTTFSLFMSSLQRLKNHLNFSSKKIQLKIHFDQNVVPSIDSSPHTFCLHQRNATRPCSGWRWKKQ